MERDVMVRTQIEARGIGDPRILEALSRVPRHLFVPESLRNQAYEDHAVSIGHGQTISQPYIVALMTRLLNAGEGDKILEIGTGSGYQAAVLAEMGVHVFTVESVDELYSSAETRLKELGYSDVRLKRGDGYYGWEEESPFDGILVAAAAVHIPPPLVNQLKPEGVIVIPIGDPFDIQQLIAMQKDADGTLRGRAELPVRFVPFTGAAQKKEP
jgi:protein-L-isoaspartate(D-aspartate) O-methyltransferase